MPWPPSSPAEIRQFFKIACICTMNTECFFDRCCKDGQPASAPIRKYDVWRGQSCRSDLNLFAGELWAVSLQVLHDALHAAGAEQPERKIERVTSVRYSNLCWWHHLEPESVKAYLLISGSCFSNTNGFSESRPLCGQRAHLPALTLSPVVHR